MTTTERVKILPLDQPLELTDDERAFLTLRTGITDEGELSKHLHKIQKSGYSIYPYPCIRSFRFVRLKAARHFAYPTVLQAKDDGGVFLDVGCCFGTDPRKAVQDGWPVGRVLGSELHQEFLDVGYSLFLDHPGDALTPAFLAGDIFCPSFLSPVSPPSLPSRLPALNSLTSLNPLKLHVQALHAAAFFHLFSEAQQKDLAGLFLSLMRPGGTIFGSHIGAVEAGVAGDQKGCIYEKAKRMWCHSPESWKQMWSEVAQAAGRMVTVKAGLRETEALRKVLGTQSGFDQLLIWSVTVA